MIYYPWPSDEYIILELYLTHSGIQHTLRLLSSVLLNIYSIQSLFWIVTLILHNLSQLHTLLTVTQLTSLSSVSSSIWHTQPPSHSFLS